MSLPGRARSLRWWCSTVHHSLCVCVCLCVSLTESSAGVAQQLQSTRQVAEELMEVQNTALQAQQEILNNGEELRVTLRESTRGNTYTHTHSQTAIFTQANKARTCCFYL